MPEADLIVVGAGPAGMLAARTAADAGLSVLLLDEQARAGGQIYRNVERAALVRSEVLGKDFSAGLRPVEGLCHAGITHLKRVVVWQVENGRRVYCSVDGTATVCTARRILLATGAIERSMPVPGWTLPGVMTAGAAQILLKQSGIVCERAVLVGTGPLLYLVAAQMVRAGSPPLALIETQTMRDLVSAQRHVLGAMLGWRYLVKGLGLLAEIVRARVPRYTGATDVRIEGSEAVRSVRFHSGGRDRVVECDTALLHHGVVPNTQIARSIGVEHRWSEAQQCFVPSRRRVGAQRRRRRSRRRGRCRDRGCRRRGLGRGARRPRHRPGAGRDPARRARRPRRGVAPAPGAGPCGASVHRSRLPAVSRSTPAGGWHRRVSLRGGDGRRYPPVRRAWVSGSEPSEGLRSFRDGTVPGTLLRTERHHAARGRQWTDPRRHRLLPHPPTHQARDARRARDAGDRIR